MKKSLAILALSTALSLPIHADMTSTIIDSILMINSLREMHFVKEWDLNKYFRLQTDINLSLSEVDPSKNYFFDFNTDYGHFGFSFDMGIFLTYKF